MCGVAGIIFKKNQIERNKIINMNGLISHRGPDQSGYLEYQNLLLGHVRLSVLDISNKGRQPMSNDDRFRYSVVMTHGLLITYSPVSKALLLTKAL